MNATAQTARPGMADIAASGIRAVPPAMIDMIETFDRVDGVIADADAPASEKKAEASPGAPEIPADDLSVEDLKVDVFALLAGYSARPTWWPSLMAWPEAIFLMRIAEARALFGKVAEERAKIAPGPDLRQANPALADDIIKLDGVARSLDADMRSRARLMADAATRIDRTFLDAGVGRLDEGDPGANAFDRVTRFVSLIQPSREKALRAQSSIALMARERILTHDKSLIEAAGKEVRCSRATPLAMAFMVEEALGRGWKSLSIDGTPEFRERMKNIALAAGLSVVDRHLRRRFDPSGPSQGVELPAVELGSGADGGRRRRGDGRHGDHEANG